MKETEKQTQVNSGRQKSEPSETSTLFDLIVKVLAILLFVVVLIGLFWPKFIRSWFS